MNSNQLKLLGCLSMLIDHITYCFIPRFLSSGDENVIWYIGRGLGRSAFVIFAFLLVEGFFHTKNIKKYILRLSAAAVISEAAFDFMGGRLSAEKFLKLQNMLFLFLLGLIIMYVLDFLAKTYYTKSEIKYNILASLVCLFGSAVAYFSNVDYGMVGFCLILIFYFFHNQKGRLVAAVVVWSILCLFMDHMLEWAGLIALIPIVKFYNGERGKDIRWFFYIFYPAHMVLLGIINMI